MLIDRVIIHGSVDEDINPAQILELAMVGDPRLVGKSVRTDRRGVNYVRSGASRELSVTYTPAMKRDPNASGVVRATPRGTVWCTLNYKYADRESQGQSVFYGAAILKAYGFSIEIVAAVTDNASRVLTLDEFGRSGFAGEDLVKSLGEKIDVEIEEVVRDENGIPISPF